MCVLTDQRINCSERERERRINPRGRGELKKETVAGWGERKEMVKECVSLVGRSHFLRLGVQTF